MLWKEVVADSPASVLVTTIAIVYALTLIGPREANTGDPREIDLTATFATILPMSVCMIADLFFFAALDKVVNPALRFPAMNDLAAEPASVCVKRAKAVPVSITLIPNCLGALRLERLRRLTTIYS
jgi:hypothetical protein